MSEDRAPYVAEKFPFQSAITGPTPKQILSRVMVFHSNDAGDLRGKMQGYLDLANRDGFRLVSMTQSQNGYLVTVVVVVQREEC